MRAAHTFQGDILCTMSSYALSITVFRCIAALHKGKWTKGIRCFRISFLLSVILFSATDNHRNRFTDATFVRADVFFCFVWTFFCNLISKIWYATLNTFLYNFILFFVSVCRLIRNGEKTSTTHEFAGALDCCRSGDVTTFSFIFLMRVNRMHSVV